MDIIKRIVKTSPEVQFWISALTVLEGLLGSSCLYMKL